MSALANTRQWLSSIFRKPAANTDAINDVLNEYFGGSLSDAGIKVNASAALSLSAAFSCTRVLMEDIASLPIITYRRLGDNRRERATEHKAYSLLHDQPNPEMTAFSFKEFLVSEQVMGKGAFAEIERTRGGDVAALWPIPSRYVTVQRNTSGDIEYAVKNPAGGESTIIPTDDMLHIPGLCFDGYTSKPVYDWTQNVFGLALAVEKTASLHFANGGSVKEILEFPGESGSDAAKQLKKDWVETHGSLNKTQRSLFLAQGLKYTAMWVELAKIMPPEVRTHETAEIARLFRMPLHKIMQMDRATWGNVEQMQIEYVQGTLMPWLIRWEQALGWKLRTIPRDTDIFFEFLVQALLRGDYKSRMEGHAIAIQNGMKTRNEVRALENDPPVDGGDEIFVPLNMAPLGKVLSGEVVPNGQSAGSTRT
jgi:HK97 family phage portal protein